MASSSGAGKTILGQLLVVLRTITSRQDGFWKSVVLFKYLPTSEPESNCLFCRFCITDKSSGRKNRPPLLGESISSLVCQSTSSGSCGSSLPAQATCQDLYPEQRLHRQTAGTVPAMVAYAAIRPLIILRVIVGYWLRDNGHSSISHTMHSEPLKRIYSSIAAHNSLIARLDPGARLGTLGLY